MFSSTAGKYIRPGFQGGISTTGRYNRICKESTAPLVNVTGPVGILYRSQLSNYISVLTHRRKYGPRD